MWYATPTVEQVFSRDYDAFGDSYTQPVTMESLKLVLENVHPNLVWTAWFLMTSTLNFFVLAENSALGRA